MNILIDAGHPAHVHYYRNLADGLREKGDKVLWSVKDVKIIKRLLDHYGFDYTVLPGKSDTLAGKVFRQVQYNYLIWKICRREKIDLAIGTSASVAHVSKISSVKSVCFDDDDDDVQPLVTRFVNPFADTLLSPAALTGKRKRKDTIFYPGYHELAYLHPARFHPDISVLKDAGIKEGEKFFLMRFNVFKAHHDIGETGLSHHQKRELINLLEPYGKVLISSEREIEPELKAYQIKTDPVKIHSLISYATMFLGDSQTMTSEAAMLGVPSLRCNSFAGRISYLEEQEIKYGLTYGFLPADFNKMLEKVRELIDYPDLYAEWQKRRLRMLDDMIDVTGFWIWFLHNYPESIKRLNQDPCYYDHFK